MKNSHAARLRRQARNRKLLLILGSLGLTLVVVVGASSFACNVAIAINGNATSTQDNHPNIAPHVEVVPSTMPSLDLRSDEPPHDAKPKMDAGIGTDADKLPAPRR